VAGAFPAPWRALACLVTIDGVTEDRHFISTGEKLVLLDSAEGQAIVKVLSDEHAAHLSETGE
jgi:hypothetical protein